jgi:energy-coupling factor transporter transmembrane protein EcfT
MANKKFLPSLSGFVAGQGFMYRVEAKWKLTGALLFLLCTAFSEWQGLLLLAVICFFALRASDISLIDYLTGLKPFIVFLLVVTLFPLLFNSGLSFSSIQQSASTFNIEVISLAGQSLLRMLLMFSISSILLRTTPVELLLEQMNRFVDRNRWLGDFGKELVIVGGLSLKVLPWVCNRAEVWINDELKHPRNSIHGSLLQKTRRISQLIGPLIVGVLREHLQYPDKADRKETS